MRTYERKREKTIKNDRTPQVYLKAFLRFFFFFFDNCVFYWEFNTKRDKQINTASGKNAMTFIWNS